MDEENKLSFRDTVAIEVFNNLLKDIETYEAMRVGRPNYTRDNYFNYVIAKTEILSKLAYKIADQMRKARLAVFE